MARLRNATRWLAKELGVATSYHVSATYTQDSHMSVSIISMTVTIKPWLHVDNYSELVSYVESQATRCVNTPGITSITKLGA